MTRTLGIAVLLAASAALAPAQAAPEARVQVWRIVGPDGATIGFQHEEVRPLPDGYELLRQREMYYRIDGHPVTQSFSLLSRRYDAEGKLVGFTMQQGTEQRLISQSEGTVQNGQLTIRRQQGKKLTERSQPWPKGLDLGDSLAADQPAGTFAELAPSGLRYDLRTVTVTNQGEDRVRSARIGSRLAGFDVQRSDGSVVLPRLGYDLQLVPQADPLTPALLIRPAQLAHEMRTAPYFASREALRGQIRYQFAWRFGFDWAVPQTGEQAVRQEPGRLRIDICAACGPGLPSDAASLAKWRQPSPWIESNDPAFKRVASSAPRRASDAVRMEALGKLARERMGRLDFEGHLSARAAWKRGSGDCTEDAVVLAALARAAGIPARVASGMVYSRSRYHGAANAFLPHTWVVAFTDGRWRSYDVSLEGFDASHIALSIGDGEPAAISEATLLAALLDWQGMAEVRKRDLPQ